MEKKSRVADMNLPANLAKKLFNTEQTEKEKVRSIFNWITDNIEYNTIIYQRPSRTIQNKYKSYEQDDDTSSVLLPLDERVARQVLQRRVAVCDGYARLFKVLCDYAGVRSEIIYGYARTNRGRVGQKFYSNHTWNAVYLDNSWHLLDVTWASGYISYGSDAFIKQLNEAYYLTPPQQFIEDHYPELIQWSLLPSLPNFKEFQNTPFKSKDFVKSKIRSFQPTNGLIEAAVGDTLVFEINASEEEKQLLVTANPYLELGLLPLLNGEPYVKPTSSVQQNKVTCTYIVASPFIKQLHVVYNGRIVLQYNVQVKNNMAVQLP